MDLQIHGPARSIGRAPGASRGAFVGSVLAHAVVVGILFALAMSSDDLQRVVTPATPSERIVWIAMPGPSGGGGGRQAAPRPLPPPPPRATTQQTAPSPPVPTPTEIPPDAPEPLSAEPLLPAPLASQTVPGALTTGASLPGGGSGDGSGVGDGRGAGPGTENGFGGGAYRAGNGVTSPEPTYRASPQYTAAAVRARAQGIITVDCVVEPNGECGDVRIARAFKPPFGLDQQALETARRWRFRPGTRDGQPVPVLVSLEIEFTIR